MNRELTEKLFNKYPKLFGQSTESPEVTCMCWGFECGDGWYWLIDQLCDTLQNYIDSNHLDQIEVVQVKEKYGTLSFYVNSCDDLAQGMIWFAESLSGSICEKCGSTNNVTQTIGWIKTLCETCMKENN